MEDEEDKIALELTSELLPLSQPFVEITSSGKIPEIPINRESPEIPVKRGITFSAHVRRLFTDARDSSLNITLTIFENQDLEGLLALRDQSVEVALIKLPEFP